jgi:hypothetical protein
MNCIACGGGMNIDIADFRDLSVYRGQAVRGAPGWTLAGVALLPLFGAGAALLGWNWYRASQQRIVISHAQIWLHDTYSSGQPACIERSDVARIEVRQTKLQKFFNTGDLTIHSLMLERPMTICSIPHVEHLKRRLTKHMKKRSRPVAPPAFEPQAAEPVMPVPVGQAKLAPAMQTVRKAA